LRPLLPSGAFWSSAYSPLQRLCCAEAFKRLTFRSRRTASPPLNSSVRGHELSATKVCSNWSTFAPRSCVQPVVTPIRKYAAFSAGKLGSFGVTPAACNCSCSVPATTPQKICTAGSDFADGFIFTILILNFTTPKWSHALGLLFCIESLVVDCTCSTPIVPGAYSWALTNRSRRTASPPIKPSVSSLRIRELCGMHLPRARDRYRPDRDGASCR
jgi:hypothetical protein